MKLKRTLSFILSLTVAFTAAFGYAAPAFAKSSRAAEVVEVVGDVQITKAGGSKSYRAYEGMTLNQGDHVKTGKGAKLVLNITDHDDELTVDQNASLYISELTEEGKGKKSKVKMWAGSLWSKVKTLAGAEDEFEVETPTAVMGVRGTNLFAGVDQESGDSTFMIGSGFGEIKKNGTDNNSSVFLYPSQQLKLIFGESIEELNDNVSVIDLDTFVANAGPAIIEAIVQNKAALDQENAEFIEKQKQAIEQGETTEQSEQLGIKSLEDLNRITNNLDNLIGNIVNKAIEQNKVDSGKIQEVINKANENLEKKIDLKAVKPIVLTDEEQAKLQELKRLEEERKKQLEEEKKRQEELKKQNEELLKKLEEQKKKQEEANRLAAEEAKKKAEEELKKRLDAEALAALLARQAELERQRQLQQQQSEQNTNVDNRTQEPTDTNDTDNGTGGTVSNPTGKLIFERKELAGGYTALVVSVENFTGSNSLFAAQLNMVYDDRINAYGLPDEGMNHVLDDNGTESVIRFDPNVSVTVPEGDAAQLETLFGYGRDFDGETSIAPEYDELIYAEVKATSGAKEVAGKTVLMIAVFENDIEGNANIQVLLKKALFIKVDGSSIPVTSNVNAGAQGYLINVSNLAEYSGEVTFEMPS